MAALGLLYDPPPHPMWGETLTGTLTTLSRALFVSSSVFYIFLMPLIFSFGFVFSSSFYAPQY